MEAAARFKVRSLSLRRYRDRGSRALQPIARERRGCDTHRVFRWVLLENGESSYINGAPVTGGFFKVLGTRAAIGRELAPSDDISGAEPVVVISDGLWRWRYGSSRDIVGRRLHMDEQAFTIVGVMPPGIDYPRGVEVWRPSGTILPISPLAMRRGARSI